MATAHSTSQSIGHSAESANAGNSGNPAVDIQVAPLLALADSARALSLRRTTARALQNSALLSHFRGRGMEYDESRSYQQGDDMRHIDWRVTARTGKAHTKVFREERERPLFLCVDIRAPMRFATKNKFKSVTAAECAVLLAWCAANEGDKVGGVILSDHDHCEIKPIRGKNGPLHLIHRMVQLDAHKTGDKHDAQQATSHLDTALSVLARIVQTGSLVFVISDLHDFDSDAFLQLAEIGRRAELALVHVTDPLEETLPPPNYYAVCDDDDYMLFNSGDRRFAKTYASQAKERRQNLRTLARSRRIQFMRCPTDIDAMTSLRQFLGR